MPTQTLPRLTTLGVPLNCDDAHFGWLQESNAILGDFAALRARMAEDGYLYLRDFLDREQVQQARAQVLQNLQRENIFDPNFALNEAVLRAGASGGFRPDLAADNLALQRVLYDGAMMEFWRGFFDEEVRHFDFTWLRAMGPGHGTPSHCDIVYMGRGTRELFTAWTPLSDIPLEMGGLLVLESSHRHQRLNENYGRKDVDAFCSNRVGENHQKMGGGGNIREGGALSNDALKLQRALGGRWLTSPQFCIGDVLLFTTFTVHGSLDNQTQRLRLSSDSRYQRASQPADERWIGAESIGHGPNAKRSMIC